MGNVRRKVYLVLCIVITVVFVTLAIFPFRISYMRLWESIKDFGLSIAYYFCDMFGIEHNITPTVIFRSDLFAIANIPSAPSSSDLPGDFEKFKVGVETFFTLFFERENFLRWFVHVLLFLINLNQFLTLFIMVGLLLWFIFKKLYGRTTTRRGDTLPLRAFKKVSGVTYQPIKTFITGFIDYVKETEKFGRVWIVLSLFNLNIVTIIVAFFAYYFYFIAAFDFATVYMQFVKLWDDLQVVFYNFPWWSIVGFIIIIFNRWRVNKALDKLRHMGAMNMGYIKSLPIVTLLCGLMGSGKTTIMSSMVRYNVVIMRQQALDILMKTDMKFPYFPWVKFEDELRDNIDTHRVYNLATVEKWVKTKCAQINEYNIDIELYGYDYRRYGLEFDDGAEGVTLDEALEVYAKAYFVYVLCGSLAICNYSLRTNENMMDQGNLPMWVQDFFTEGIIEERRAHVMDFDAFRLGKKVIENNPKIGSFEFGVVAITEIGKERGNNLELKETKKSVDVANQKNDGFNAWLKMCRHSATIDNVPFIKVLADEQRPESWGADARDLSAVLHVGESSDVFCTLPFFGIERFLSEWAYDTFCGLYQKFRYNRGDNTLLVHILKSLTFSVWKRNLRNHNKYGYKIYTLGQETGNLEGKVEEHPYYLCFAQVYGSFRTDCFGDFFKGMALNTDKGLMDWPEYVAERATENELAQMNSYFMRDIYDL